MGRRTEKVQDKPQTETDAFPTLDQLASRLSEAFNGRKETVRRIDIRFGANGDGNYRLFESRDDDPVAGVLPKD
jgi:hypothetical protein